MGSIHKILCCQGMHLVLALVLVLPAIVCGRGGGFFHCDPDLLPCTDDGNGDACDCPSEAERERRSPGGCKTEGGKLCTFPFIYRGKKYNECTAFHNTVPWCATTTLKDWSFNGNWGNCDCSSCTCPTASQCCPS